MQLHLKALFHSLTLILTLSTPLVARAIQETFDPVVAQHEAIQALDRVLEKRRRTGDIEGTKPDLLLIGRGLGNIHRSLVERGDWAAASLSAAKLGLVLRLLNMPAEGKQSFEFALQHAVRAKHTGHQVAALLGLAKTELYRSGTRDFPAVGRYIDQAIALAEPAGDKEGLCDAYQVRAELELEERRFTAALDAINRSFPLSEGAKDPMLLFYAYQTRGMIYSEWAGSCDYDREATICAQRLDKAKEDFEKAQTIMRNLGYTFLVNLMDRSLKNVEQKRALIKLKEVDSRLSASTKVFNPQSAGNVLVSETFLPPKTSDSLAGSPGLLNNMKLLLEEQIKRTSDGATGMFLRGSLKDLLDEPDVALDYYLKAVKLLDSDSGSLQPERSVGTFLENKIQIYYNPMLHLLERKRYAEAFDLMENSRTRAMADLLRSQKFSARPEDQGVYSEFLLARSLFSMAQQTALREEQIMGRSVTGDGFVRSQEQEYQKVLNRMNAANSKLLGLVAPQTATLSSVQQSMKQDRYELLYYMVLDKQLIIWHLSGDETHVVSVFLPRLELIKKVNLLRQGLKDPGDGDAAGFDRQTASELFLFLIQPVRKWIKTDHLVIIPHEDLNYLPFQVFYDAENSKYLGEMFQLSYAPSATILSGLKKINNISGGNLLAVDSTELVEGEKEVKALGQLFSGRSKVVVDPRLKQPDLKSWIPNYDLVHLSIHGKFNQTDPLLSYLMLNGGKENDDQLSTAEMFGLPLTRAKLVVLSACETGESKATRANEIIGMQRALLYAGANNLVLSSWKVDAAATELWMTTFYREAQSKSFSEASRGASMAVKNKYSHPYYWSPFILIGK